MRYTRGWFNESYRHALSAKGIKTSKVSRFASNNFLTAPIDDNEVMIKEKFELDVTPEERQELEEKYRLAQLSEALANEDRETAELLLKATEMNPEEYNQLKQFFRKDLRGWLGKIQPIPELSEQEIHERYANYIDLNKMSAEELKQFIDNGLYRTLEPEMQMKYSTIIPEATKRSSRIRDAEFYPGEQLIDVQAALVQKLQETGTVKMLKPGDVFFGQEMTENTLVYIPEDEDYKDPMSTTSDVPAIIKFKSKEGVAGEERKFPVDYMGQLRGRPSEYWMTKSEAARKRGIASGLIDEELIGQLEGEEMGTDAREVALSYVKPGFVRAIMVPAKQFKTYKEWEGEEVNVAPGKWKKSLAQMSEEDRISAMLNMAEKIKEIKTQEALSGALNMLDETQRFKKERLYRPRKLTPGLERLPGLESEESIARIQDVIDSPRTQLPLYGATNVFVPGELAKRVAERPLLRREERIMPRTREEKAAIEASKEILFKPRAIPSLLPSYEEKESDIGFFRPTLFALERYDKEHRLREGAIPVPEMGMQQVPVKRKLPAVWFGSSKEAKDVGLKVQTIEGKTFVPSHQVMGKNAAQKVISMIESQERAKLARLAEDKLKPVNAPLKFEISPPKPTRNFQKREKKVKVGGEVEKEKKAPEKVQVVDAAAIMRKLAERGQ